MVPLEDCYFRNLSTNGSWGDGSVVKNTNSCRGQGFDSRHPPGDSTIPNSRSRDSSDPHRSCIHVTHIHILSQGLSAQVSRWTQLICWKNKATELSTSARCVANPSQWCLWEIIRAFKQQSSNPRFWVWKGATRKFSQHTQVAALWRRPCGCTWKWGAAVKVWGCCGFRTWNNWSWTHALPLRRKDSASSGSDLAYMRGALGSFWMQRQKLGTYNDL